MKIRYGLSVSAFCACVALVWAPAASAAPDAAEKEAPAKDAPAKEAPDKTETAVELPKDDTHAKVMTDMMAVMGKMGDIIAGATDEPTAKVAAEKLGKLEPQLKKLGMRAKALGDPNPVLEKELEAKFKPQMEAVQGKMMKAMLGLAQNPEAAKHIQAAMEKIGRTMSEFD